MDMSETRTAGQAAARLIRDKIFTGELPSGAGLNQAELAREFGMSRIPIRDALQSLAAEGFVELRAHATASVTPLGIDDLRELYEIRTALEPHLCVLAIGNLDADRFDEMEATLDAMEADPDIPGWLRANNRFHQLIYGASGRNRTVDFINSIRRQTDRYTRIYYTLDREVAELEHRMILEAARRGQEKRLHGLVLAHLSAGYETIAPLTESIPAAGEEPLA